MRFTDIKIINFGLLAEAEFTYPESGLILIEGINHDSSNADSNMAGKTTFIEALLWALFEATTKEKSPDGTTISGFKVEDVVRYGKKECTVELGFVHRDEQYRIIRTRQRGGGSSLTLLKGKEAIKAESKAATQSLIDNLIGYSWSTFTQTVFYGQGSRRFIQAKDSERKSVLEDLLGLGIYSKAREVVTEWKKVLSVGLERLEKKNYKLTVDHDSLAERLTDLKQDYKRQLSHYKQWESAEEKRIKQLKKQINGLRAGIKHAKENITMAKTEKERNKIKLDKLEGCEKKLNSLRLKGAKAHDKVNEVKLAIRSGMERLAKFEQWEGECPTCEQDVPTSHVDPIKEGLVKELKKLREKRENLEQKEDHYRVKVEKLEKKLEEFEDIQDEDKDLDYEIRENKSKIKQNEEQIEYFKSQLKPTSSPLKPSKENIVKLNKEIEKISNQQDQVSGEMLDHQTKLEELNFWFKGFGPTGVKSLILDSVLPILNQRANEYISILTGGDTQIEFDTQSQTSGGKSQERFDIRINTTGGEGYHLTSGGERSRISFCVALALQALQSSRGNKCNLFILDEPFESMDEAGQEQQIQLLQEFVQQEKALVFVVTHLRGMKALFDHTIQVVRRSDESKLELT